jgi:hypothetical protein
MQARNYVIIVLMIAIICLSTLCYLLLARFTFVPVSNEPVAASPTAAIHPTPTSNPITSSTRPTPTAETSMPIPKPSTPEFTLKFVNNSYDIPPKYKVDEFSGQEVLVQAGQHFENKSIQIIIKNQPFTSLITNGHEIDLYYNASWKGHYGDEWRYSEFNYRSSGSDYSVITIMPNVQYLGFIDNQPSWIGDVSQGDFDFQVQAFIGYWTQAVDTRVPMFGATYYEVWTGQISDWSSIQTITIP